MVFQVDDGPVGNGITSINVREAAGGILPNGAPATPERGNMCA